MNCPACSNPIDDDSRFCRHCGAAVGGSSGVATSGAPLLDASGLVPAAERPVLVFRPAWRAFAPSWCIWLAGTLLGCYLIHRSFGSDRIWWKLLSYASASGAAFVLIRQARGVLGRKFRLTTQRLFIERGLLARTTDQTELIRVEDVRVEQGVVGRLLNVGTVRIRSTDATDPECVITGVEQPARIVEEVRRCTRAMRGKQTLYVEKI